MVTIILKEKFGDGKNGFAEKYLKIIKYKFENNFWSIKIIMKNAQAG